MVRKLKNETFTVAYDDKNNTTSIIGEKGTTHGFKVLLKKGSVEDLALREKLFKEEIQQLAEQNIYKENGFLNNTSIILGNDHENREVCWDFRKFNSLLIRGGTATGKTQLFYHVLKTLLNDYGSVSQIYAVGEEMPNSYNDKKAMEKSVENVHKEMNNRYRKLKDNESDVCDDKPVFLAIDAAERLVERDSVVYQKINELIRKGRAVNIHVLLTVSPSVKTIKASEDFTQTIHMNVILNSRDSDSEEKNNNAPQRYSMIIDGDHTVVFSNYGSENFYS